MVDMQIRMQNIVGRMEEMMREQGQIREFIGGHRAERGRGNESAGSRQEERFSTDGNRNRRRRVRHERYEGVREDRHERRHSRENALGSVKIKNPSFKGRSDPEAYLEWEMKMEQAFMCHGYPEEKKVKLAVLEFTDYALVWWDEMRKEQRRNGGYGIDTWEDMKFVMRKRFVPSYYHRELHNKLQRLVQG